MQQTIIPNLLFGFLYFAPQDFPSIPLISATFAEEAKGLIMRSHVSILHSNTGEFLNGL
jgi:hypothetical protein